MGTDQPAHGYCRRWIFATMNITGAEPGFSTQCARGPNSAKTWPPTWNAGDTVHWKNRAGAFRRDVGDGEHAEIVIGVRYTGCELPNFANQPWPSEISVAGWSHSATAVRAPYLKWLC
jgi:hypothetical protein